MASIANRNVKVILELLALLALLALLELLQRAREPERVIIQVWTVTQTEKQKSNLLGSL